MIVKEVREVNKNINYDMAFKIVHLNYVVVSYLTSHPVAPATQ